MQKKPLRFSFPAGLLLFLLLFTACTPQSTDAPSAASHAVPGTSASDSESSAALPSPLPTPEPKPAPEPLAPEYDLQDVPWFDGTSPYYLLNGNVPYFSPASISISDTEIYSEQDALGRCGTAFANISPATLPVEDRTPIFSVEPSGWHSVSYPEIIEDGFLYNRCHLIAFSLAGENDNACNLITGTRFLNLSGMRHYENLVLTYVRSTGNHVLYRVTPVFSGSDLLCTGVILEGWSQEDNGSGICFNVYCYNVQPGIGIDYATGESWADGTTTLPESVAASESSSDSPTIDTIAPIPGDQLITTPESDVATAAPPPEENEGTRLPEQADPQSVTFILNTNRMKFHLADCPSVSDIAPGNRRDTSLSRDELINRGYAPCGRCNP